MAIGTDLTAVLREAEEHLRGGRLELAGKLCEGLITGTPDPRVLMILSLVRIGQQRLAEADTLLAGGTVLYPGLAAFHSSLARLRLQMQRWNEAVAPLEACVLLEPSNRDHRAVLAAVYQGRVFTSFSESSKQSMTALLADETLTHSLFSKAWLSLLRLDPASADIVGLLSLPTFESFCARVSPELLRSWQGNEFLNGGLKRFLVPDPVIERGLANARRWFFTETSRSTSDESPADRFLSLACVLAGSCFLSEYVFGLEEDPAALRGNLTTPGRVALLGCYEPLFGVEGAAGFAALSDDRSFQELVRTQVVEPLEERRLATTIEARSAIDDDVSRAVQRQYEENPYPRWVTVGSHRQSTESVRAMAAGREILVAGCGTGREALEAASIFPSARVDAVDLSRPSLAYGLRKAREAGATNLRFFQADILSLGRLQAAYDFIVCAGVLHHMKDPAAGLRALVAALKPGGVMRIGLYSALARAAVVTARAWIAREGFTPTAKGIRAFRAAVVARPDDDPLKPSLTTSYDFYSMSACRDFLFHVQEHTFTLVEIEALTRQMGLRVLQVDTKLPADRAAYQRRFPDDPEATSLENWHALELDHPRMFAGLYSLWLGRAADKTGTDWGWIKSTQTIG